MASILGKTARWPAYDERVKNHHHPRRRRRRRRRHHRRRRRPRRYDIILDVVIIIIIIIFIVIVNAEQHQNEYLVVSSLSWHRCNFGSSSTALAAQAIHILLVTASKAKTKTLQE